MTEKQDNMKQILKECPICDKENWHDLDYMRSVEYWEDQDLLWNDSLGFKICKECGFVTYDYWKMEEIKRRYNIVRPSVDGGNIITGNRKNAYHRMFLNDTIKTDMNVMDVGCAAGMFLNMLHEDYGIPLTQLFGTEISDGYINFARNEYKLDINHWSIDNPTCQFDIISYYHVLEHIQHPLQELLDARKFLKDDGYMYISIPVWFEELDNSDGSLCMDFENYVHLFHVNVFSRQSFKNLLAQAGLEIVKENDVTYGYTVLCKKTDRAPLIIKEDYKLVELYFHCAKMAIELAQKQKYLEALEIIPSYPDVYAHLCMTKEYMKQFIPQKELLDKATRLMPKNSKVKLQLAKLLFQWAEMGPPAMNNKIRPCVEVLHELEKEQPWNEDIYYFLAMIAGNREKNYQKARHYFDKVLKINPAKFHEVWKLIGVFWSNS